MSVFLTGWISGVIALGLIQFLACRPIMRRHRVVMALLDRAKVYNERAKHHCQRGEVEAAAKCWVEAQSLIRQVEEIHSARQSQPSSK